MVVFNLDDPAAFAELDSSNMLAELVRLPQQLKEGWTLGFNFPLPEAEDISLLVVAGMGGSAIAGDLLAAYCLDTSKCPIQVLREYQLPAWVQGRKSLVVASSHSGNTEETISVFNQAIERDCSVMVLSTGGLLSQRATEKAYPVWNFIHSGQPRSAVGYSFGLLLALVNRLNIIPDSTNSLNSALDAMNQMIETIHAEVPVKHNLAKRMAGQMINRWVTIVGSDHLAPIARRYKTQINELAKTSAQYEILPELDHNTLAGIVSGEETLAKSFVLFLSGSHDHPRNQLRMTLTRMEFMQAGINTDVIEFKRKDKLAEMWSSLVFGDFLAYYLAIAYQEDPTPIVAIQNLKKKMI